MIAASYASLQALMCAAMACVTPYIEDYRAFAAYLQRRDICREGAVVIRRERIGCVLKSNLRRKKARGVAAIQRSGRSRIRVCGNSAE
ncbi:hypothetical protein FB451DRAFT_1303529 [Mycena latifolia]|nr:hypothetical protein FB451DRAFT_1303529 [Mycena latifolia]